MKEVNSAGRAALECPAECKKSFPIAACHCGTVFLFFFSLFLFLPVSKTARKSEGVLTVLIW